MKQVTKAQANFLVVGTLLLALFFTVVYVGRLKHDAEVQHHGEELLRTSENLDYRLNESVLRLHSFLSTNYDSIAAISLRTTELCEKMRRSGESLHFQYSPAIEAAVQGYCVETERRLQKVEEFKSLNSVLRNSIAYIPVLLDQLSSSTYKYDGLDLFSDILRYCVQPNETAESHMRTQLAEVLRRKARGGKEKEIFAQFQKHIVLLIDAANRRQGVEKVVLSADVASAIQKLRRAHDEGRARFDARARLERAILIGVIGILVISMLVLLLRLQQAGRELADLNSGLEDQVSRRTAELSQALADLERQQQVLAHSTKMSALGEMAGGIAHEINTPLAAIVLTADSLRFEPQSPETTEGLRSIVEIVGRIARIITGLRKFSRASGQDDFRPVRVSTIVEDTLVFCSEKFRNGGVRIEIEVSEEAEIDCQAEQVSQVLLNLLHNSYDAIQDLPEKWIRIEARTDGHRCRVSVIDSGPGIPPAIEEKIMQPFFTTKGIGKGTGLGLSISKGILQSHAGNLRYVRGTANTAFEMDFPAAGSKQRAA